MISLDNLKGFSEDAAFRIIRGYGHVPRTTKVDYTVQKVDATQNPNRVNVELENGKVVKAYFG